MIRGGMEMDHLKYLLAEMQEQFSFKKIYHKSITNIETKPKPSQPPLKALQLDHNQLRQQIKRTIEEAENLVYNTKSNIDINKSKINFSTKEEIRNNLRKRSKDKNLKIQQVQQHKKEIQE